MRSLLLTPTELPRKTPSSAPLPLRTRGTLLISGSCRGTAHLSLGFQFRSAGFSLLVGSVRQQFRLIHLFFFFGPCRRASIAVFRRFEFICENCALGVGFLHCLAEFYAIGALRLSRRSVAMLTRFV